MGTLSFLLLSSSAFADGNVKKVNHIIIVMQENHSFDNYFGALAFAPGSPYHNDLEGMFDFTNSPSLNTAVGSAQPPQNDCTP